MLIDRGELDEAEEMLNGMIKDEQDVDFANSELEYIKAIKDKNQEKKKKKEEGV